MLGAGLAELLLIAAGDDVLLLERGRPVCSVEVPDNLDPTRRSGRVRLQQRERQCRRHRGGGAGIGVGSGADVCWPLRRWVGRPTASTPPSTTPRCAEQFGRTIATFQAIKHHCANMLVAIESAIAAVWDASRAASEDEEQFRLVAAVAAALAFPAYARNAELNIQVHGGIGFTWEHDAHLHLRRALVTSALFGGDAPGRMSSTAPAGR